MRALDYKLHFTKLTFRNTPFSVLHRYIYLFPPHSNAFPLFVNFHFNHIGISLIRINCPSLIWFLNKVLLIGFMIVVVHSMITNVMSEEKMVSYTLLPYSTMTKWSI